jgi:hypothetical protein
MIRTTATSSPPVPSTEPPAQRLLLLAGVAFLVAFCFALIAAYLGFFGPLWSWALAALGVLLLIATVASFCVEIFSEMGRSGRFIALFLIPASVIVFLGRWVHPTENSLGGSDEGIYALTAVNLTRTGSCYFYPALLPGLPKPLRPWAIKQEPAMANRTARPPPLHPRYHACLLITDPARGQVASQFPPGFPVLLGAAYAVGGYTARSAVNVLLVLGSAFLASLLMARWQGAAAGTATFLCFLWFPLEIWIGNSLFSEPLLQFLWLLHLFSWIDREQSPLAGGILAGLTAGLASAVKIDAFPVEFILLAAALLVKGPRMFKTAFSASFLPAAGIAGLFGWQYNRPYWQDTLQALIETNHKAMVAAVLLGCAGIMVLLVARHLRRQHPAEIETYSARVRRGFLFALTGAGIILAAYAWWIRPNPAHPDSFYYWPAHGIIRSYREETFARLAWYWQPWALAIAVASALALFWRAKAVWQWLLLAIGALFLISFCYDLRNNPIQPYAMRRFMPYAMPFLLMGCGWGVASPLIVRSNAIFSKIMTVALAGLVLGGFWPINAHLNSASDYAGLRSNLSSLAAKIPANAILLTPDQSPLSHLASPLEFVYERPCLRLTVDARSPAFVSALTQALEQWQKSGRQVFLLSGRRDDTFTLPQLQSHTVSAGTCEILSVACSSEKLVTEATSLKLPWFLNQIQPASSADSSH